MLTATVTSAPAATTASTGNSAKTRHTRVVPFRRKGGTSSSTSRKPPKEPEPPAQVGLPLPARHTPLGRDELDLFPHQLRTGDRYTDDSGQAWIVASAPTGMRHGKVMVVRFRSEDGSRAQWQQLWDAHVRVRVRRAT